MDEFQVRAPMIPGSDAVKPASWHYLAGKSCLLIGLVAIPFNGVAGPSIFGELRGELSVAAFLPAIALSPLFLSEPGLRWSVQSLTRIGATICGLVIVSFIWNYLAIADSNFHGRNGLVKFATTFAVLGYGLALSFAAIVYMSRRPQEIGAAITLSAIIAASYAMLEYAARSGIATDSFRALDAVIRGSWTAASFPWNNALSFRSLDEWDTRLRSVSFEPPAFGNYCGLALPWVAHHCHHVSRRVRPYAMAFLAAFVLLIVVAQARTGLLLLGVCLVSALILRAGYLTTRSGELRSVLRIAILIAVAVAPMAAGVYYFAAYPSVVAHEIAGDSVSNLTRLATQVAAVKIFLLHPFLGVGLGQFAYYEALALPSWGYLSYELGPTLIHPDAPWPAVYSIYPRLAAECGIFGVLGWPLLWLGLLVRVVQTGRDRLRDHRDLSICYPAALTCILIPVSGLTTDTFRTPMIWIGLAASIVFISAGRKRSSSTGGWPKLARDSMALSSFDYHKGIPTPLGEHSSAEPRLRR